MLEITMMMIVALTLDWLLGEPQRWHPLVGFGKLANQMKKKLYGHSETSNNQQLFRGFFATTLLLLPPTIVSYYLAEIEAAGYLFSVIILTLCLGHKSLHDHTYPIARALQEGDLQQARHYTSQIVSRDPATLHIPRATIESILENGADSLFSALFWFVIGGAPAVIFYRLVNTLDAMWGYRNKQYLYFGRIPAKLDDILNYIPARLTALSYALLGNSKTALRCWRQQAPLWDSPNAGPVMASGAGALNLILGGAARYDGQWHQRIILGEGQEPQAKDIHRALQLVRQSVILWVVILMIITGTYYA